MTCTAVVANKVFNFGNEFGVVKVPLKMIHEMDRFILVDDDYDDNGIGIVVDEMVVTFEEASVSKCSNDCNRSKIVPVV